MKSGSFPRLAFCCDATAMLLDDFVNDEQSQPRTLAHVLGGKKRIKYPWQDFRRNAVTIVANFNLHSLFSRIALGQEFEATGHFLSLRRTAPHRAESIGDRRDRPVVERVRDNPRFRACEVEAERRQRVFRHAQPNVSTHATQRVEDDLRVARLRQTPPGGTQAVEWRDDGVYLTGWAEILFAGDWLAGDR